MGSFTTPNRFANEFNQRTSWTFWNQAQVNNVQPIMLDKVHMKARQSNKGLQSNHLLNELGGWQACRPVTGWHTMKGIKIRRINFTACFAQHAYMLADRPMWQPVHFLHIFLITFMHHQNSFVVTTYLTFSSFGVPFQGPPPWVSVKEVSKLQLCKAPR